MQREPRVQSWGQTSLTRYHMCLYTIRGSEFDSLCDQVHCRCLPSAFTFFGRGQKVGVFSGQKKIRMEIKQGTDWGIPAFSAGSRRHRGTVTDQICVHARGCTGMWHLGTPLIRLHYLTSKWPYLTEDNPSTKSSCLFYLYHQRAPASSSKSQLKKSALRYITQQM